MSALVVLIFGAVGWFGLLCIIAWAFWCHGERVRRRRIDRPALPRG